MALINKNTTPVLQNFSNRSKLLLVVALTVIVAVIAVLSFFGSSEQKAIQDPKNFNDVEFSSFTIGVPKEFEATSSQGGQVTFTPRSSTESSLFKSSDSITVKKYVKNSNVNSLSKLQNSLTKDSSGRALPGQQTVTKQVGDSQAILIEDTSKGDDGPLKLDIYVAKTNYIWLISFRSQEPPKTSKLKSYSEAIVNNLKEV